MSPPNESIRQPLSHFSSNLPTENSTPVRESTLPPYPFALDSTSPPSRPLTNYTSSTCFNQKSPTMNAITFVRDHTTRDNDLPHQDECPICLDNYTSEQCLRITNIPECSHHIGANCLDDLLRSHSQEEKRCPLCRAVWIPAQPLPVPPDAQNFSASRHMAGMFAGLDGIGADIANQQLGARRSFADNDTPQQQARHLRCPLPNPTILDRLRASVLAQRRTPIVNNSDSDDVDYDTHVQNFEDFRREIAEIRSRAPYRHVSRSSRRRRVAERTGSNRNGDGGANSSSNNDHATATHSLRRMNTSARGGIDKSGAGAFNRLLNNRRTLNPSRPTTENNIATPPAPARDLQDQREREVQRGLDRVANTRRQAEGRQVSNQQHVPDSNSPSPHPPDVSTRRATTPEVPIDIHMTSDELIELPAIQSLPAHEAVRSRQLDHREGNLNRQEQAMTIRQMTLARCEVELIARETRIDRLMRVARRHMEEAEESVRRHREEIDELLN